VPSPPAVTSAAAPPATASWAARIAPSASGADSSSTSRPVPRSRSSTAGRVPACRPRPAVGLVSTAIGPAGSVGLLTGASLGVGRLARGRLRRGYCPGQNRGSGAEHLVDVGDAIGLGGRPRHVEPGLGGPVHGELVALDVAPEGQHVADPVA